MRISAILRLPANRNTKQKKAGRFPMRPLFHHRQYQFTSAGGATLELGSRTLIMGILNTTPDSFSDGGRYEAVGAAVAHAVEMVRQGADMIDIGAESTRPGSAPVPLEEELSRAIPVVAAVRQALPAIPISIDTYKSEVARQALDAGANIINDIWGLQADGQMAAVAAAYGCPVVISHNRHDEQYTSLVDDVCADLLRGVALAREAGVQPAQIWLDPGIGFAKNQQHNLELMGQLHRLAELGYPVLLGTSRKRFIRQVLDLPADDVVEGTAATVALGIAQGCQIVRVHDVRQMQRVARMADAIAYY